MKPKTHHWLGLLLLVGLVACQSNPGANKNFARVTPVRAIRLDYVNLADSRNQVTALESRIKQAGVNMVAVGAGRADWTFFPWAGHSDSWSSDVKSAGIDFLAQDSARFGKWAHVSAVVDVLAPLYIQAHPEEAAISWTGIPSKNLVGTIELVEGNFGRQLLDMIQAIAANYPVNSITLTEIVYHVDGYGPKDKAAYLTYTGRTDWPRLADGQIDIADPSIGLWRSYEIGRLVEKAAAITHKYDKQLFVEVRASSDLKSDATDKGTNYELMLKYADELVVWSNYGLAGHSPEYVREIVQTLRPLGSDRVIVSIGLWQNNSDEALLDKPNQAAIGANEVKIELQAAQQGGMTNFWVTPSFLLGQEHWQVLTDLWGNHPVAP
jgi:hypothetical protein